MDVGGVDDRSVDCGIDWSAVWMWLYFICCAVIFVYLVYRAFYYHLQLQEVRAINKKHREKKPSPEPVPVEKVKTNSCVC